ncbi:hypothetical protein IW261DRAFT_1581182 [Armillaria novae-zelandiae]|uniref:Agmatinase n=1 Tax=Armillaria novae-zelandiae TaxID=153914 RepID=A0AA39UQY6_9AGAR|nr:hypothetical protein IW261DRAFT_1581182 [Armillaria novae-zelandiae]
MKYLLSSVYLATFLAVSGAEHDHHHHADQMPLDYVKYPLEPLYRTSSRLTAIFSGITTFAKLPWVQCLTKEKGELFDIAFIGAPFDTGTSYRPGARFGPAGIRTGSRRLTLYGGYNVPLESNPFQSGLKIVDCGDIPVTLKKGTKALLHRETYSPLGNDSVTGQSLMPVSIDWQTPPSYTWKPSVFGGAPSDVAAVNHGTYFYWASQEGLIKNGSSIASASCSHGAIRTTLSGLEDYDNDDDAGFKRIEAREIDDIGTDGIIKKIRETVGDLPVYLSIDIDSIDPAFAPATGTPETGGWSTREIRTILRGLDGLHLVGADIVEVAPAYDTNAELTTIAAADVLFEVLTVMAKTPLGKVRGSQ